MNTGGRLAGVSPLKATDWGPSVSESLSSFIRTFLKVGERST
jgi:hypothetical protein